MSEVCLVAPTTAVKAVGAAGTTTVNTAGYDKVTLSSDVLADAEEVDIYVAAGGTFVVAANESGTAYKLTATVTALQLVGGPIYSVAKDETASACGVYARLGV